VTKEQYLFLAAAVLAIAVAWTVIAGALFLLRNFLPEAGRHLQPNLRPTA
jgi:hypothetical protein